MNTQTEFPLFEVPDYALLQIFSHLTDDEYITMLNLYENQIPETISKIRLHQTFGEDLIIEDKLSNRGWHYITKNLLQYSKNQSIVLNATDNRYLTVENDLYLPIDTNQMPQYTHLAQHPFGKQKRLHLVKNYENNRIVIQSPIHYYEVTFEPVESDITYEFAIGLCHSGYEKNKMVGWEKHSIGYHSDDGRVFFESGSGSKYGETYGKGDTIGCGFDTAKSVVFYTKNGKRLSDVKVDEKSWFPAISLKKWKAFTINFGEKPFMYDVYGFKPIDPEVEKEEKDKETKVKGNEIDQLLNLLNGLLRDLGGSSISLSSSSDDDDSDDISSDEYDDGFEYIEESDDEESEPETEEDD